MASRRHTKATILRGVEKAAAEQRLAVTNRDHLIAVAVKYGHTQETVASAAGMSQAHVSRIVSYFRRLDTERKAARAAKRAKTGEPV